MPHQLIIHKCEIINPSSVICNLKFEILNPKSPLCVLSPSFLGPFPYFPLPTHPEGEPPQNLAIFVKKNALTPYPTSPPPKMANP